MSRLPERALVHARASLCPISNRASVHYPIGRADFLRTLSWRDHWCKVVFGCALVLWGALAGAQTPERHRVPLYEGKPYLHVVHEGRSIRVEREQNPDYVLSGYFAKTSRDCPPFCLGPMHAAPGVTTIGEIELFHVMETTLRDGQAVLVDSRTPDWYKRETIPGAVNIPFTEVTKAPDDPAWDRLLPKLGAKPLQDPGVIAKAMTAIGLSEAPPTLGKWDLSAAKDLVLFCNGPACDQSRRAILALTAAGYPPEKLFYYRGGMQIWQLWGLTTVVPSK